MAGEIASLFVKLGLDAREFQAGIAAASKSAEGFSKSFTSAGDRMQKFGDGLSKTGTRLSKHLTLPILGAGVAAFKFASDVQEASSKAATVYGDAAGDIVAASKNMNDAFDEATYLDTAGTFGALLTNMGFVEEEAADLSVAWLGLAQDMASFHNASPEEALQAIQSALSGEFEPLKRFGVMLNETVVKQKAMEMGLWDGKGAIDAQTRALVVNQEVFRQQPKVLGDFERTSEGAANSTRILLANFKDTAAELGKELLPLGTQLLKTVNQWVISFKNLSPETKTLVVQLGAAAAAAGPLLLITGKLTSTFGGMLKVIGGSIGLVSKILGMTAATTADTAATTANTTAKNLNAKALTGVAGVAGAVAVGLIAINEGLNKSAELSHEAADGFGEMSTQQREAAADMQVFGMRTGDVANGFADLLQAVVPWHEAASAADEAARSLNGTLTESVPVDAAAAEAMGMYGDALRTAGDEAGAFATSTAESMAQYQATLRGATVATTTDTMAIAKQIAAMAAQTDEGVEDVALSLGRLPLEVRQAGSKAAREAHDAGVDIADNLADAVRSNKDSVRDAMDALTFAMKNPLARAKELARIEGKLTGQKLANGLSSENDFIRETAQQTEATLIAQWESLSGKSYTKGSNSGDSLADGLNSQKDEVAERARQIRDRILSILPDTIPIGVKLGLINKLPRLPLFAEGGFLPAGKVGVVGEDGPELIVGGSSGSRITPLTGTPVPAMAGVGGEVHIHIHGSVYGGPAGLDELTSRIAERLRFKQRRTVLD